MTIDFFSDQFNSQQLPILIISITTTVYVLHWFLNHSTYLKFLFRNLNTSVSKEDIDKLSNKVAGFIWFGIIPLELILQFTNMSIADLGLTFSNPKSTILWMTILVPLPIIINYFAARKPENLNTYPQIRTLHWNRKILSADLVSWAFYLMGYEILFRGILLFGLAAVLGPWTSIAINVMIYTLVHIPKGSRETLGAIPLGFILCILCLNTGNFWLAFVIHLSLAWSNELFSLKYHPEISFHKKGGV